MGVRSFYSTKNIVSNNRLSSYEREIGKDFVPAEKS